VVDDDPTVADVVGRYLVRDGHTVECVHDGQEALRRIAERQPDLVVLDLMLPGIDGLEVCRRLRERWPIPVVMLTALGDETDRLAGFEIGADDYVTKPFSMDELLARLRATSRRVAAGDEPVVVAVGDVTIDLAATTAVLADGTAVHLTPTEWKILDVLLRRPGKLVASDALLTAVRGSSEHTDPSYLRIYLAQLRRKLEPEPSRPRHLITEPGMGYRYRP